MNRNPGTLPIAALTRVDDRFLFRVMFCSGARCYRPLMAPLFHA